MADEAKPAQIRAAARQLARVERLAAGARNLALGEDVLAFADRVGRDAVAFGDVLNALENGSRTLQIPRVASRDAQDILAGLGREFRHVVPALEPVLEQSAQRPELRPSLDALAVTLGRAENLARDARNALSARAAQRFPRPLHLLWLAVLTALACLTLLVSALRERSALGTTYIDVDSDVELRAERLEASRNALREQLAQLAACLNRVADGQLDVRREPRSDDEAGAVYSALERVLDRMRDSTEQGLRLVRGGQVLSGLTRTLRDESRRQAQVMEQIGLTTRDMAAGLDPLAREGHEAGEAARSSSGEARRASESVQETLHELEALQGAASDCSQRVQRLEAAAREMVSVRELVEDVSELGKLLSLNVAIQASVDNEASRALGAFSDEVQRLSDRARGAMLRINVVHEDLREEARRAASAINDSLARARTAVRRAQLAGASLLRWMKRPAGSKILVLGSSAVSVNTRNGSRPSCARLPHCIKRRVRFDNRSI